MKTKWYAADITQDKTVYAYIEARAASYDHARRLFHHIVAADMKVTNIHLIMDPDYDPFGQGQDL
jgi:hypothetical protein